MVTLDPLTHQYKDENGVIYTSVTQLLSKIFVFNTNDIIAKITKNPNSKYYGMTPERIKALWNKTGEVGTELHLAVENYIKHKTMPSDKLLVPLVEQFAKLKFKSLKSEILVSDEEYLLAGTIDILEDSDKYLYIWDVKTSNKMTNDKLLKFSYQLELYKRLAEKTFNRTTKLGGILWFEDLVVKRNNSKLKIYSIVDCKDEVDAILSDRKRCINETNKYKVYTTQETGICSV